MYTKLIMPGYSIYSKVNNTIWTRLKQVVICKQQAKWSGQGQSNSAQRITSLYEVDDLALLSDSMGEGVLPRKIINLYHVKDFTFR